MRRRVSALISIPLYVRSMSLAGGSARSLFIRHRAAAIRSWRRQRPISRLFPAVEMGQTVSPSNNNNGTLLVLKVPSSHDMEDVGALLATSWLGEVPPETTSSPPLATCLFLQGDLGAGKTTFARGFVRGALGDDTIRVTSPTYLLSNTYSAVVDQRTSAIVEIHHMDLYRLTGKDDQLAPLNLNHVFASCISLIEWPSRLLLFTVTNNNKNNTSGPVLPDNRLVVDFRILSDGNNVEKDHDASLEEDHAPRRVTLTVHGNQWKQCMEQIRREGYLEDMIMLQREEMELP